MVLQKTDPIQKEDFSWESKGTPPPRKSGLYEGMVSHYDPLNKALIEGLNFSGDVHSLKLSTNEYVEQKTNHLKRKREKIQSIWKFKRRKETGGRKP